MSMVEHNKMKSSEAAFLPSLAQAYSDEIFRNYARLEKIGEGLLGGWKVGGSYLWLDSIKAKDLQTAAGISEVKIVSGNVAVIALADGVRVVQIDAEKNERGIDIISDLEKRSEWGNWGDKGLPLR